MTHSRRFLFNHSHSNYSVYLHDGDGGDGGVRERIFSSQGAGVVGTLREADLEGVHQTGQQLDQLPNVQKESYIRHIVGLGRLGRR